MFYSQWSLQKHMFILYLLINTHGLVLSYQFLEHHRVCKLYYLNYLHVLQIAYPLCMLTIQLPPLIGTGPPPTILTCLWTKHDVFVTSSVKRNEKTKWGGTHEFVRIQKNIQMHKCVYEIIFLMSSEMKDYQLEDCIA